MPIMTARKEKHHAANSRIRRHSDSTTTTTTEKRPKKEKDKDKDKDKDTDTESVISIPSSTTSAHPATSPISPVSSSKCPLRILIEDEDGEKIKGCPLRRIQLWHTIPLCLLAIINLLLVIVALLGLAGYRIVIGVKRVLIGLLTSDLECEPFEESENVADTDQGGLAT